MKNKNEKTIKKTEAQISKKESKRVGIAKEEMQDFDISLEEFNSVPVPDFK